MAKRAFSYYELDLPIGNFGRTYYVCDTEKDKPSVKETFPGDQAYVRDTKTLYVADGEWIEMAKSRPK